MFNQLKKEKKNREKKGYRFLQHRLSLIKLGGVTKYKTMLKPVKIMLMCSELKKR